MSQFEISQLKREEIQILAEKSETELQLGESPALHCLVGECYGLMLEAGLKDIKDSNDIHGNQGIRDAMQFVYSTIEENHKLDITTKNLFYINMFLALAGDEVDQEVKKSLMAMRIFHPSGISQIYQIMPSEYGNDIYFRVDEFNNAFSRLNKVALTGDPVSSLKAFSYLGELKEAIYQFNHIKKTTHSKRVIVDGVICYQLYRDEVEYYSLSDDGRVIFLLQKFLFSKKETLDFDKEEFSPEFLNRFEEEFKTAIDELSSDKTRNRAKGKIRLIREFLTLYGKNPSISDSVINALFKVDISIDILS